MRKKALLVEAGSSYEGPWVHLEDGTWLVEPTHSSGTVVIEEDGKDEKIVLLLEKAFFGPTKIRAIVDGAVVPINLDARQVFHAKL
jgi:hypothetical protein